MNSHLMEIKNARLMNYENKKMICTVSKYKEVELFLQNDVFDDAKLIGKVRMIERGHTSFEDSLALGEELAKRWNNKRSNKW